MDLTQEQWLATEPYFPKEELRRPGRNGGRPWRAARDVLNGVLWVLRTGAPWSDLPRRYPPYQTCHRRFQRWVEEGILPRVLAALRRDLEDRDGVLTDRTLDAAFVVNLPPRLIGDKAWDSEALQSRLAEERNIELIAPKRG